MVVIEDVIIFLLFISYSFFFDEVWCYLYLVSVEYLLV